MSSLTNYQYKGGTVHAVQLGDDNVILQPGVTASLDGSLPYVQRLVARGLLVAAAGAYRIVSNQAIDPPTGDGEPPLFSFPRFYIAATGTVGVTVGRPANWINGDTGLSWTATSPALVVNLINADLQPHGLLARLRDDNHIEIVSATAYFYDALDYDGGPIGQYFTPLGTAPFDASASPP